VDRSVYLNGAVSGSREQEGSYPILILNNKAKNGGGIYVNYTKDAFVKGTFFRGNSARSHGGAVFIDAGGGISFSNCFFFENSAGSNGGAIYLDKSGTGISDSLITRNSAGGTGGGLYNNAKGNTLSSSVVTDNTNYGIYDNSKLTISGKMTVKNNGSGVDIDLEMALNPGVAVAPLAGMLQERLKNRIFEMTGIRVGKVSIMVEAAAEAKAPKAEVPELPSRVK
jgi:predicted outer membrane repeat protein